MHNADINAAASALGLPTKVNGHDHGTEPGTQINTTPQHPVLLVDSTDTATTASQYLPPGWTCHAYDPTGSTSLGSITHAVIWGRNDEGGRTWAEAVADTLAVPSTVVTLASLPVHWHLGEPLPAGRTPPQLTSYLANALGRCQQRARVIQPTAPPPTAVTPPRAVTIPDIIDLPYIRSGTRGDGAVKPIMANARMLLDANPHRWDLRYNDFSARTMLGVDPMTDQDILSMTTWVQASGVHAGSNVVAEAANAVAGGNRYHPVREYLDPLQHDGIPRLDMVFVDHAGTPDTPLVRAMTSKWFIQAVARIYRPGCQADGTLVLEGIQGLRKSSFFRELFGDRWFTDHLPDLASKDALLQLRGVWCVEIGELATLGRAESAKIKQFLTSQVDRYRDPYGRVVADFPRTCVFAGSINPGAGGYLKDETGARRFWPIPVVDKINTGAIGQLRDQLWAEAVARFKALEPWFLETDALTTAAHENVAERFSSDPWQEKIEEFLARRDEATVAEIFKVALNMPDVAKWNQADMNRIGRCLAFAGWIRVRRGAGARRRWAYVPGDTEPRPDVTPGVDQEDGEGAGLD